MEGKVLQHGRFQGRQHRHLSGAFYSACQIQYHQQQGLFLDLAWGFGNGSSLSWRPGGLFPHNSSFEKIYI